MQVWNTCQNVDPMRWPFVHDAPNALTVSFKHETRATFLTHAHAHVRAHTGNESPPQTWLTASFEVSFERRVRDSGEVAVHAGSYVRTLNKATFAALCVQFDSVLQKKSHAPCCLYF